jgi:hypothetical protein
MTIGRRIANVPSWGKAPPPPLPACGERVGVRGLVQALRLVDSPPHPARKSAPTSPRARGEVLPSCAAILGFDGGAHSASAGPLPNPPPQAGEGARGTVP